MGSHSAVLYLSTRNYRIQRQRQYKKNEAITDSLSSVAV